MQSRIFEASISNLDKIMSFLRDFLKESNISVKKGKQFEVAIEEAVVNIIKYAYQQPAGILEIVCSTNLDCKTLEVKISDSGIPFNPLQTGKIQGPVDLEKQTIGGLGIYFIKKMSDSVTYEFFEKTNVLTLSKKIIAQES